jgi:DNA-binding NtrC family response regulator
MTQPLVLTLVEAKRRAIVDGLRATDGNMKQAAQLLMVGRTTLYRKVAELDIRQAEWRSA